jgi:4-amino-4-deoxy-L-arabinose transferase-like glycosyltransferase
VESDAVSRVWQGWLWLAEPHWISHGVWGPLHTYLNAISLAFYEDPVLSPIALQIGFSSATAVVVFFIAKNAFGMHAGLFAAGAAALYPVAIRNSLLAVSETPFTFFVGLSMLLLLSPRAGCLSWQRAVAAGVSMTLAAMLRYEAWVLIPMLGASLYRRPALLGAYLVPALAFPAAWMLGNAVHHGDPLYSVHIAEHWQMDLGDYNQNVDARQRLKRFLFFPSALFAGLTPWIAVLCVAGAVIAVRRHRSVIWSLVPFVGLLAIFMIRAIEGSLLLRGRYSLVLGTLLLPYVGALWEIGPWRKMAASKRVWVQLVALALMVPFSLGGSRVAPRFMDSLFPYHVQAVPMLADATQELSDLVNARLREQVDAGFICDYLGAESSFGVALLTRLHPDRIFIAPAMDGRAAQEDQILADFFETWPAGVLVLGRDSPFARRLAINTVDVTDLVALGGIVSLERCGAVSRLRTDVYRYQLLRTP